LRGRHFCQRLFGEHGIPGLLFEQRRGLLDVTDRPGGDEAKRPAKRIGQVVDPGRQSASGTPRRLIMRPHFSVAVCLVSADDGAVDHQILAVAVRGERIKYPLPYVSVTPAAEASM
jgi:hypothetical protein